VGFLVVLSFSCLHQTCSLRTGTPESGGIAWALPPLTFQKGVTGAVVPFHNSIIGNFMVYQARIETNFLQLFAHPENSEGFSIISLIIFEANIVAK